MNDNKKKTSWLRYFANERLDPDGQIRNKAVEYAEIHNVDVNNDKKMNYSLS